MNQDLYKLYLESRPDDKGYTNRLKTLWENKFQDLSQLTSRHLAEQVRNIKKKNSLNDLEIQVIELQYKADNTTTSEETLKTQQQQQLIPEDNNERQNSNQRRNLEKQREDYHEQNTNTRETELNEEDRLLKEQLRDIWKKNFDKYLGTDINMREYSTHTKPLPDPKLLQILGQIITGEMNNIKTSYSMDYWIMNVIYYSTAVTVLQKEERLREEKRKSKANEKPGWKIFIETRIQAIRRKLSHTYILQKCVDTQQYMRCQNIIKRKMEKWYGKINYSNYRLT